MKTEEKDIHTATLLLGSALSDMVPQGYLLTYGRQGSSFYYDIVMGEELSEALLPHLENRMKELVKKDLPIKTHEMVPSNAAEFFRYNQRFYPSHFVKKSREPLVKVVQMDAFIELTVGEYCTESGEVGEFKLVKIEERLPLKHRKDEKRVFRVMGAMGSEKWVDPYRAGEELSLFEVRRKREDYLEVCELCWKGEGEALLFALYQKWRHVHLKEGFEIVVGGQFEKGWSAEFFFEKGHHFDRAVTHCMEGELEAAKEKCQKILKQLVPFEWKKSILEVRKNQGFYTIEHSAFPSVEEMILEVLGESEKDLSQKKELLRILTLCDE